MSNHSQVEIIKLQHKFTLKLTIVVLTKFSKQNRYAP